MGSGQSAVSQEDFKKEWILSHQDVKKDNRVWISKKNSEQHLYEHTIPALSESQQAIYALRATDPLVVSAFLLDKKQSCECCGEERQNKIFVEGIPVRLNNLTLIPYPDAIHLYDRSLRGFGGLVNKVGCFHVNEDMIGINENLQSKVWLNSAFQMNKKMAGEALTEQEMLNQVLKSVETSIDFQGFPPKFPLNFRYPTTFADSIIELSNYCGVNKTKVPDRLECINTIGGIKNIVAQLTKENERPVSFDGKQEANYDSKQLSLPPLQGTHILFPDPNTSNRTDTLILKTSQLPPPPPISESIVIKPNESRFYHLNTSVQPQISKKYVAIKPTFNMSQNVRPSVAYIPPQVKYIQPLPVKHTQPLPVNQSHFQSSQFKAQFVEQPFLIQQIRISTQQNPPPARKVSVRYLAAPNVQTVQPRPISSFNPRLVSSNRQNEIQSKTFSQSLGYKPATIAQPQTGFQMSSHAEMQPINLIHPHRANIDKNAPPVLKKPVDQSLKWQADKPTRLDSNLQGKSINPNVKQEIKQVKKGEQAAYKAEAKIIKQTETINRTFIDAPQKKTVILDDRKYNETPRNWQDYTHTDMASVSKQVEVVPTQFYKGDPNFEKKKPYTYGETEAILSHKAETAQIESTYKYGVNYNTTDYTRREVSKTETISSKQGVANYTGGKFEGNGYAESSTAYTSKYTYEPYIYESKFGTSHQHNNIALNEGGTSPQILSLLNDFKSQKRISESYITSNGNTSSQLCVRCLKQLSPPKSGLDLQIKAMSQSGQFEYYDKVNLPQPSSYIESSIQKETMLATGNSDGLYGGTYGGVYSAQGISPYGGGAYGTYGGETKNVTYGTKGFRKTETVARDANPLNYETAYKGTAINGISGGYIGGLGLSGVSGSYESDEGMNVGAEVSHAAETKNGRDLGRTPNYLHTEDEEEYKTDLDMQLLADLAKLRY